MAKSKEAETRMTFQVKKTGEKLGVPRWKKVNVENAACPTCGQVMAVWTGDNMYGFCPGCQCYYLAD